MHRAIVILFVLFAGGLPAAAQTAAQTTAKPGQFDYYLLSLSWSPQFCAKHGMRSGSQCAPAARQGFVAHGLWPENENGGFPLSCRPAARVPDRLVERMLAFLPGEGLIQHEWATHGTCSGLAMDDYFDSLARAFRKVQLPSPLTTLRQPLTASLERIKQMFAEANPGMTERMMAVLCTPAGEVSEIRLCLDRRLDFRTCGGLVADRCRSDQAWFRPPQ